MLCSTDWHSLLPQPESNLQVAFSSDATWGWGMTAACGVSFLLRPFNRAHECRFIMGSNKMLQVALGKSESDELRTNLHELGARLKGPSGLFFTKLPREEVGFCHNHGSMFALSKRDSSFSNAISISQLYSVFSRRLRTLNEMEIWCSLNLRAATH